MKEDEEELAKGKEKKHVKGRRECCKPREDVYGHNIWRKERCKN